MSTMATARNRFGRADVVFPDPVPDHPLLAGLPEIGRGEYSIVLGMADPGRVMKLLSSPADYFLLTADDRPAGTNFPILFADHGVIGRASTGYLLHLVEIERLHPLAPGSAAAQQAELLMEAFWLGCREFARLGAEMGRIALFHLLDAPPAGLDPELLEALRELSNFIESYQVRPDILSDGNLMARADGTLVFSDPVFLG
jgi:hypothetical protein